MSNATDIRQSGGTAKVWITPIRVSLFRAPFPYLLRIRCIVPRSRSVLMARM